MKPSQRLFVASDLVPGASVTLEAGQAHYLANVLRLPIGGEVLLFNGRDGEWIGALASVSKKGGAVMCVRQSRVQETLPDLWLLFAPVKGDRTDYIVEKATELGVAGIVPVITERTIVRKVNQERLQARCIEAAEQCGRLCVPAILPAQPLSAFYQSPSDGGLILFADEAGQAVTIGEALSTSPPPKIAILIGPEGGFTPQERDTLRACAHVRPVTLGPRILRADTAAYAGLTLVQSAWGDWKDGV
jgi:16S rRNA (uracil1498-N3)-methyltransferase